MNKKIVGITAIGFLIVVIVSGWYAQNQGFNNGVTKGKSIGYQQGQTDGYATGWGNGLAQGRQEGYDSGYLKGTKDGAGTGYNIRDPSYQEMLNFLASDQTDKKTYNKDSYNCYDYTNDVCNNAFNIGIRCGDVWITFPDTGHAIVCFKTTDRGLIFIEPQSDGQVTLTIGQHYWDRSIYEAPNFDDTIINYGIIW